MRPIVFCASLEPWLNAIAAALRSCSLPKTRPAALGVIQKNATRIRLINNMPTSKPNHG